ncbi:MAG TPA: hypothetical protein DC054_05890 [Blastocatellia bacterium]|nr:hypothetical protein [Blastocatellia bacterium]
MPYVSDELTHFVGRSLSTSDERFALLVKILKEGALRDPSHIGKKYPIFRVVMVDDQNQAHDGVEYSSTPNVRHDVANKLSDNSLLQFELVCFCDIPLSDITLHCKKYSHFGIAFKKPFLIAQGAGPVMYVPHPGSFAMALREHHSPTGKLHYEESKIGSKADLFDDLFKMHNRLSYVRHLALQEKYTNAANLDEVDKTVKELRTMLFYQTGVEAFLFGHLKFFDPLLASDDDANYYMEREWRVAGSVQFDLADVSRVIVESGYETQFKSEFPDFAGLITELDAA